MEPAVTIKDISAKYDEAKNDGSNKDTPPVDNGEGVKIETTEGPGDNGEIVSEEKVKEASKEEVKGTNGDSNEGELCYRVN